MQIALHPQADQRSAEILALVRQAFVEKGFDGASMQDLARTAGMSVGNFYRYFPSKAAIITALIAGQLDEIQRDFQSIIGSDAPMATLRQVVRLQISGHSKHGDAALWTEIEAAARRSPDVGAAAQAMETAITQSLIAVFAAETGLAQHVAARRFSAAAAFIMVQFKAASCLNCAQKLDQVELRSMIIRTIDQTLDDVATSARKA